MRTNPTRRFRLSGVAGRGNAVGRTMPSKEFGDHSELYDLGRGPLSPNTLRRRRVPTEWDDPVLDAVLIRADIGRMADALTVENARPTARARHQAATTRAAARTHIADMLIVASHPDTPLHGLWVIVRHDGRHRRYWANRPDLEWWTDYIAHAAVFATDDLAWLIGECYQDGTIDVERA